ncbi:hypothetical protein [Pararhodobacter sp.]|uniref:hypothetical protein n=1 Tax=Pararhodobacter sp. TaxID=2127056 RepID=UPI001D76373D|nr:hypothetical protein [Pararhodobacter sp.]MCB1344083.1 hypothetical protein [Paracoccaceae bacterium]
MGYSTPKKQLDLKEFLSMPGRKPLNRAFSYRGRQTQAPVEDTSPIDPVDAPPAPSAKDIQDS